MTKIAWITDSTSGFTPEQAAEHNIHLIPLYVVFDNESFRDGMEITNEEFYARIDRGELPKTSQPSVGDFAELYKRIMDEGYKKGIAVLISANLSGTLETARMAAEMVGFDLAVIDSKITSFPLAQMVLDGQRMEREGKDFAEIVEFLQTYPERFSAYIILDNLEFVHRGGRMNAAQFLLGNLLQIKPILHLPDGRAVVFEKVRSFKKAKSRIFELLSEYRSQDLRICVIHTNVWEQANEWKKELQEMYSNLKVSVQELGSAIAVHAGPGSIGLAWIR
ncbi:DegV family protein [Effusibacillus lacus]|uniref:Fatty acid-binding protein DegV n=1 Tax=Effusibacillus lacus TaxID=1348429 RepID=A0A292YH68_9BACL|nr:DegV family protein [Effusibacillus lacus]TCS75472.1 DegV family protein with EDD domain [Effusibacillus lacus]GAX88938.1 fatty acid-binding protein DegV [Effusibacillus lacus]